MSGTATDIKYSHFEYGSADRTKVINLTAAAMMKSNTSLSAADAQRFAAKLFDEAKRNDVSLALAFAIMQQESNFTARISSNTGAGGLMQLTRRCN